MPLRPICIGCCTDCDSNSVFTSCQHFVCAGCVTKFQRDGTNFCPQCKVSCRAVRLGDPDFPSDIRESIVHNSAASLQRTMQIIDFQSKQQLEALDRARASISQLQSSLRETTSQLQGINEKLLAAQDENSALREKQAQNEAKNREELRTLTEKLRRYEGDAREPREFGRSLLSASPFIESKPRKIAFDADPKESDLFSRPSFGSPRTASRYTGAVPEHTYTRPMTSHRHSTLAQMSSSARMHEAASPYVHASFSRKTETFHAVETCPPLPVERPQYAARDGSSRHLSEGKPNVAALHEPYNPPERKFHAPTYDNLHRTLPRKKIVLPALLPPK